MSWLGSNQKLAWFRNLQQPYIFVIDGIKSINQPNHLDNLSEVLDLVNEAYLTVTLIITGTSEQRKNVNPYIAE